MFRSEYADVPPVELPIHEAVLGRAAEFGDTPALVDGTNGMTLTYAQVDQFHRRVAAALADAGVRKGDVLALHSPNTVAFPTAFYAATRAGASVTTVHPLSTAEEFAKQLRDSAARWIVTVSPLLETARRAAELAGGVGPPAHRDRPLRRRGHAVRRRTRRPLQARPAGHLHRRRATGRHRQDPAPGTQGAHVTSISRARARGIKTLSLDSSHNRNALSAALVGELADALTDCGKTDCGKDGDIRAVFLSARLFASADAREGMTAFLARREPPGAL